MRHVADAVVYMASLPWDAHIQFLTVMASKMPYIGRGTHDSIPSLGVAGRNESRKGR